MKTRFVLSVLAFICIVGAMSFFAEPSRAEGGCPDGYFPIGGGNAGWQGCAPMGGGGDEEEQDTEPRWATRWGAVAVTNGAFGYSTGWSSKGKAIKEALSQCSRDAGGATCKLRLAYHDQCIALAWGANGNIAYSALNIATAERQAMDSCSKYSGDCKIYYTGCSYPERTN